MNILDTAAGNQEELRMQRYRSITGNEHLRSRPPRHIRVTRMGRAVTPWLIALGLIVVVGLAIYGACAGIDRYENGYTARAVAEMRE